MFPIILLPIYSAKSRKTVFNAKIDILIFSDDFCIFAKLRSNVDFATTITAPQEKLHLILIQLFYNYWSKMSKKRKSTTSVIEYLWAVAELLYSYFKNILAKGILILFKVHKFMKISRMCCIFIGRIIKCLIFPWKFGNCLVLSKKISMSITKKMIFFVNVTN